MPRIQLKLAASLAALVVLVVAVSGWIAERGLREREMARIERSLRQRTELARELVAGIPLRPAASPTLDALARRAADSAHARVTLIARDGTVVADSDVPLAELPAVENHAGRPEIQIALAGDVGVSSRRSRTVHRRLLYLAIPGEGGVVRLAVDLDEVEAAVSNLRRQLLVAGALGLAAALALSFGLSAYVVRPLQEMRAALGSIAGGDLDQRVPVRTHDEVGDIARALNAMADELRARIAEIRAEQDRLAAVVASMVEGVLVLDTDARVVLANPRARELLAIYEPVEGRKTIEVIRHPGIDEALRAAAEAGEPVVREVEVTLRGERPRTLLLHAVRFPTTGHPMGTVAVFHDVTELRHLENVRRDFVANASHELQTPLTAIRGFAETALTSTLSPDEARSQIEVILRNAERLENLIRDMLELSRIESRRLPLQPCELDVERLASAVLRDMEPRMQERRLDVSLTADAAVPAWADRRALEQVLTNLLDNAAKYTDPGGRVAVEISARPDAVRVAVADTGMGISPEDRERIFERFYRVDKARSLSLGGTGLGLSIVKHLVQAMGGDVFVESEPGRGSTFRFTLPRADSESR